MGWTILTFAVAMLLCGAGAFVVFGVVFVHPSPGDISLCEIFACLVVGALISAMLATGAAYVWVFG